MKRKFTILTAAFMLLTFLAVPLGMRGQTRAEEVYSTCLFGGTHGTSSGYTSTWTATNGDFTWSVSNGNTNGNNWNYVKFGRKDNASVGKVTTSAAYPVAITKVAITIDNLTASKINSIKLYTSSNNSSWAEAGTFTKVQGTQTVTLDSPTTSLYYKIEFDCAAGTSNGLISVSKVEYYHDNGSTDPEINVASSLAVSPKAVEDAQLPVEYNNLGTVTSGTVTLYDSDDNVITPAWLTADFNNDYSKVIYTTTDNTTGAENSLRMHLAVSDGTNSAEADVAITQDFILTTMDQIFARATANGNTAKDVTITLNDWVVSGVYTNGKNVFVTDGTKGFVIFNGDGGMGFVAGNILSGTVACKVQLYNGFAEVTQLNSSTTGISTSTGGTVTAANIEMANLAGINTGTLVSYENLTCSVTSGDNPKYNLSDGTTTLQVYNALFAFDALEDGKTYNITGVYQQFNTTKEILPRSADDIEKVVSADPVINANNVSIDYDATSGAITYTIDNPGTGITLGATCDADWVSNIVVGASSVTFTTTANEGNTDRTATFTLTYTGAQDKTVTVTQGHYVVDYAVLPFSWAGGFLSDFNALNGTSYSLNDAGSYGDNNAPYRIKFTKTGDYLQVKTDSQPDKVTIGVKMIGGSNTSTITVQGSADGQTFTDIETLTISGAQNDELTLTSTQSFGAGVRYVRLYFTKGSNVGVGPISITKYVAPENHNLTVTLGEHVDAIFVFNAADLNTELIEYGAAGTVQVPGGTSIVVSPLSATDYVISSLIVNSEDVTSQMDQTGAYTFTMPASDVTITATAQRIYTISFYVNGTVDSNLEMTVSSTLGTLPTPAAASVPTGFQFCGWMVKPNNDYYNASTAPAMVNASTAVSTDMDLAAVFAQTDNSNLVIGELTATEIADEFAAGGHAYGDAEVEYVDGDFTWSAKYSANNGRHWMQLKNDADVYLKIEAPSSIQNVEVVISNTSNLSGGVDDITMHGAYDGTGHIYLNTTNGGTHVGTTSGSDVVNNHATIVPSGDNTTLYLQVDKGARIWGVTVTCGQSTYCDYTTLVVSHDDQTTIAYPDAETFYGIHYINGYVLAGEEVTNNGKLVINENGLLDMDDHDLNNTTFTNLIIKDGAQLYTPNAVNGTIQKNITGYGDNDGGYYLVTAPATTVIGNNFYTTLNGDVDIYLFDQNEENFEWRNFKQATSAWNIGPACAMLYANKNDITLSFNGDWTNYDNGNPVDQHAQLPATNADINVPLEYTANKKFSGVNLIGNPFPCNATVNCSFYKMNDAGSALVPATDGEVIAPCTGIIVETDGTVLNATFSKSTANATVMRGTLNMNLTNQQNKVDKAIVSFNEGSELGKISLFENNATISFSMDGKDYAVVSSDATGELPLNFKASRNGEYTLSFDTENVEMGYLHLIDNITGTDVDLLANPSYTFEGKKSDYASRFRLLFKATSINDIDTEMNDDFAFISDGNVIILNEGEATLQVIDIMGRIVSTQTVNGNASVSNVGAAGVYVLQLINGNNVKTQKIVVR